MSVIIHTDGACSGNPGPGGWAITVSGDPQIQIFGGEPATTNNRMELTAMLRALRFCLDMSGSFLIRSDSEYVLKGMSEWLPDWKRRGWRNAAGKPTSNRDLWEQVDAALTEIVRQKRDVRTEHVRGHSGDDGNEAVDDLAVEARKIVAKTGEAFSSEA